MGVFDRISVIMRANINSMLTEADSAPGPATFGQYMDELTAALEDAKRETEAFIAEETRAKELLDETKEQIKTYFEAAKKAIAANNEGDARRLITKKQELETKLDSLEATWQAAKQNADKMRNLYAELQADVATLRNRQAHAADKAPQAEAPEEVPEDIIEALVKKYSGVAADSVERELEALKKLLG